MASMTCHRLRSKEIVFRVVGVAGDWRMRPSVIIATTSNEAQRSLRVQFNMKYSPYVSISKINILPRISSKRVASSHIWFLAVWLACVRKGGLCFFITQFCCCFLQSQYQRVSHNGELSKSVIQYQKRIIIAAGQQAT